MSSPTTILQIQFFNIHFLFPSPQYLPLLVNAAYVYKQKTIFPTQHIRIYISCIFTLKTLLYLFFIFKVIQLLHNVTFLRI